MYCISHPSPANSICRHLVHSYFPVKNRHVSISRPLFCWDEWMIYMYRVYCILVSFSRNSLILPSRADEQELRKETRGPKHLMREFGRHVSRGFAHFSQNPRKWTPQHREKRKVGTISNLTEPVCIQVTRAVDPHSFFANPDPAVFLNADPDSECFL